MSAVEKILKKVGQDRSRGNDEKALQRLKEGLAREPRQYALAREAVTICFQTGRSIEGVSILRAAMKRCPSDRPDALQLAHEEFERGQQLEIGELLYDAYLAEPDYARARDVIAKLADRDQAKLTHKLQSKLKALLEDAPEEKRRAAGMLLAQAIAFGAMQRPDDMAACFDRILDIDPSATELVGRLSKEELRESKRCFALRIVLGRCYLRIREYPRAADEFFQASGDAASRARMLHLLAETPRHRTVMELQAFLLLLEGQWDAAQEMLEALLDGSPDSEGSVRRILERVPQAAQASLGLGQLFARVLAGTESTDRAVRELAAHREKGGNAAASLAITDRILSQNPHDIDALQLRARLHVDMQQWDEAASDFQRLLELEPERATALKSELQSLWEPTPERAAIGALLTRVLFHSRAAREAADLLVALRETGGCAAPVRFELSAMIAAQYGFSAELLAVFVESALELRREADARAAVQHYYAAPGARTADFVQRMEATLRARPELGELLASAFQGIELPGSLTMLMASCRLGGDNPSGALADLRTVVARHPDLRLACLDVLEGFLRQRGEMPEALELAAMLHVEAGQLTEAAAHYARAVSADPSSAERICRGADRLFTEGATYDEVWRPIILALIDVGRHREARDLCYRAAQTLPAEQQGFLHASLAACHLDAGQVAAATESFENALACADVEIERVLEGLRVAIEMDARHGHTHLVRARALLQAGIDTAAAIEELQETVRLDQMLADLVLETMREHAAVLDRDGAALALQGSLWLRKGEHVRGVEVLGRALEVSHAVGPNVLQSLQLEWDRSSENFETGIALSRALVACDQQRRAARLLGDMSRRFENEQVRIVTELQRVLEFGNIPEAHRALWEIHLRQGDRDAALERVRQAVAASEGDEETERELLEAAHQKLGDDSWITCRLAQLEMKAHNDGRAETLLRTLLETDLNARDEVLATLSATGTRSARMAILEIDALLAAEAWDEAHAAIQRLRDKHPEASDDVHKRLRLLVERGDTAMRAELDLALLMQEKGDIDAAVAVLEKALRVGDAATPGGARGVGRVETADFDAQDADADFDDAAVVDAAWRESSSDTLPAAELLDEEAAQSPQAAEARLLLASFYVDLGRVREGKELLETVLHADGDSQRAYDFLKRISSQAMQAKLKQLQEAIDRTPGDLRARLELGRLSLLARDFQGAREALGFPGDSPTLEATRRYLLARTYADEDRPHLAAAVLRAIDLSKVSEDELRRNILYLQARCAELLGNFGAAHAAYLRIVSEFPEFKDAHVKARSTYRKHLETSLETRALALEKRTGLEFD